MAPLCRESFKGTVRVSLWERDAAATWEGSGSGGTAGWSGGEGYHGRGRCILDAVESDTAAVEVGGGPWSEEGWSGAAEMREPLGSLAGAPVDVDAIAGFFKRVGVDIVPGL
jgi:methyltransferase-like protein 6/tocopherol cyclase